ncbi:MAG: TIGR02757 family protein [Bacteroidetes bacterium]|nr:MAG: TIGR02757 family protein [Bacteroidota bacterium]REJ99781.1 MAG: TIGR02757 family protein [Bacteroidota bacterium]REK34154.1 MAG: TIGR02757 family protein [Bacteroidota bacterium]REK50484.1 MAG: TIGR02757 family protein [Bacteroidota bacterium]
MILNPTELKEFLDEKARQYNRPEFIESDPISIPHLFSKKEDIEISAFLTSIISWGQRKIIIRNARNLISLMDDSPHDFILQHTHQDLRRFSAFVHRTFLPSDCAFFIGALKQIYQKDGLESYFQNLNSPEQTENSLTLFRNDFFGKRHPSRLRKHLPDPKAGSAAKRMNMFLRWMIRKDNHGVDFGIWQNNSSKHLLCPLDLHSGRVSRKLGLLIRTSNDWKAVLELTAKLREFDPEDPVKYDFALFGLGVFEKF